jgi:hypothetical protein
VPPELFWKSMGARIDKRLKVLSRSTKTYNDELTFEKAIEV